MSQKKDEKSGVWRREREEEGGQVEKGRKSERERCELNGSGVISVLMGCNPLLHSRVRPSHPGG